MPKRKVSTGAGTPTIYTNSKGHIIYENPSGGYYVLNKKGKPRKSATKAYGIRNTTTGRKRRVTLANVNNIPLNLRRKRYNNNAYNSFSNNSGGGYSSSNSSTNTNSNSNSNNVIPVKIPNTPLNNRILSQLYKFPSKNSANAIRNVSQNVWKQFQSVQNGKQNASKAAWMVLKSRGQTVGVQPYKAGFIMNKYNWKNLYNRTTNADQRKVMRYILLMLALNPPYANRKTGNRNMYRNSSVANLNNANFNRLLAGIKPVANQGQGLMKALVRTTASGAGFVTRKAINHKQILLPIAAVTLKAYLSGGTSLAMNAGKAALKKAVISGVKSKFGNNPISSYAINRAANMAANKIRTMQNPTNTNVKNVIAKAANTISNSNINQKVSNARTRIYMNIGPYAGNAYGSRNARANKGAAAVKAYYEAAAAAGKSSSEIDRDIKNIINLAVHPRSNRPPRMSNMAWAAAGSLAATAVAIPIAAALAGEVPKAVVKQVVKKGITGNGQRQAAQAAQRIAEKGVSIKNLLRRAAKGEIIPTNLMNKAINKAGGDPRVAFALEKGGAFARNLIQEF